ncbi:hypothetical protein U1Q18_047040 [Sarracenia purpurea var. burkii]
MNTLLCKIVIFYTFWVSVGRTKDPCEDLKKDAKAIVDSHFNELTIAEILTKRTSDECIQINKEIASINGGVPLIDDKYVPYKPSGTVYKDLLFALVSEETIVLAKNLGEFMGHKDENLIVVDLLLVKDMSHFISIYNQVQGDGYEDDRKEQRDPFSEILQAWAESNREADGPPPNEQECKDMMMKMYDAVLKVYEKRHPGDDIEDDLFHVLSNNDLLFAYQKLDKIRLWAKLLHEFRDRGDRYSVWILIIRLNRGENIAKINEAFKKEYGGESLSSYILVIGSVQLLTISVVRIRVLIDCFEIPQKKKGDPTVIEILAKLVDPDHKLNIDAPTPSGNPSDARESASTQSTLSVYHSAKNGFML